MITEIVEFWKNVSRRAAEDAARRRQNAVKGVTVHTVTSPSNVVRHDVRHVRPDTTPLIEQRGWRRRGNIWSGHYATRFGTWPGRIEKRGDVFHVLIKRPPDEVRYSGRFQCFARVKGKWWSIHLHDNPVDGDPSAVVAYVERLLHQSFANSKGQ